MTDKIRSLANVTAEGDRRQSTGQTRADLTAILQAHEDWLDSRGKEGEQADLEEGRLHQANLSRARLRSANVRGAHMSGAMLDGSDFTGADLYQAELDDASLVGADFTRSRLSGADLRAANLKNARLWDADLAEADLSEAKGLMAANLSGADLTNARLPDAVPAPEALSNLDQTLRMARRLLLISTLTVIYAWLILAMTTDVALLTGTLSPLPIVGTGAPFVWIYWFMPVLLLGLYLYTHVSLQHLWRGLAALPAVFPDGGRLDERVAPWPVTGLASAHLYRLALSRPALGRLQNALAIILAWWLVPLTLFAFWARYLVRQDWVGSGLQIIVLVVALSFGLHSYLVARRTLRHRDKPFAWSRAWRDGRSYAAMASAVAVILLGTMTFGAVEGVRTTSNTADPRSWVPRLLSSAGLAAFADLRQAEVSQRDQNFWLVPLEKRVNAVRGADLAGRSLRFADAAQAFLALADLKGADLKGADLEAANLESADLSFASLQNADLARAALYSTKLAGADLRGANFEGAALEGSSLQKAVLFGARGLTCRQLERASRWEEALRDESLACGKPIPAPPPGLGSDPKF